MKLILTTLFAFIILLPSLAWGDIVILKNQSGRIEGKVTIDGDNVIIETEFGSITIPMDRVEQIIKSKSLVEMFQEKKASLPAGDADAAFKLSEWCRGQNLNRYKGIMLKTTLNIDPNHAEAHAELGHVKHKGRWVTHNQLMVLTGHIKINNEWITREEAAARIQAQAEQRNEERKTEIHDAQLDKLKAERALLEIERRKISEELKDLRNERKKATAERTNLEQLRRRSAYRWFSQDGCYYLYGPPGSRMMVIRHAPALGVKKPETEKLDTKKPE